LSLLRGKSPAVFRAPVMLKLMGVIMNNAKIDELIQSLQKYELSIATLYETFATILPSSKKAWLAFANEERLHAKWINTLHAHLKNEKISFEQTKFTVQSTKTAIDFIENQIDTIIKNKTDLKQSLSIAINIEKSLLESAFFRVFKLSGPKAQKIQTRLEEATKAHIEGLIKWQAHIKKHNKAV
jgi:rubrerythrin